MKSSYFTIIMHEFLVVPNICASSAIFLYKIITYQISDNINISSIYTFSNGFFVKK